MRVEIRSRWSHASKPQRPQGLEIVADGEEYKGHSQYSEVVKAPFSQSCTTDGCPSFTQEKD